MNESLDVSNFKITSVSGKVAHATPPNPLGPLAGLKGTWKGKGFNQIWRPFSQPGQDRFLELNETEEVLQFVEIPGDIPNRGLLQGDINLHGLTYLQKINDANVLDNGHKAGIHIEPGIWVSVPDTTNPSEPATVARMANIPHGTSLLAQGTSTTGPTPVFDPVDITPFTINNPAGKIHFPEQDLNTPSVFRTPSGDIPHVTQAMLDNPNSVLQNELNGLHVLSTIKLSISTKPLNPPAEGGGTSNIAFLVGGPAGPNAETAQMDATFWITEYKDQQGHHHHLLQYTQTVLLNFNTLSWPHVSVATLHKVH